MLDFIIERCEELNGKLRQIDVDLSSNVDEKCLEKIEQQVANILIDTAQLEFLYGFEEKC